MFDESDQMGGIGGLEKCQITCRIESNDISGWHDRQHRPCSLVRNEPHLPLQLRRPDADLAARQMPRRREPHRQRRTGSMKDRARRRRDASITASATPPPIRCPPSPTSSAPRTDETVRPSELCPGSQDTSSPHRTTHAIPHTNPDDPNRKQETCPNLTAPKWRPPFLALSSERFAELLVLRAEPNECPYGVSHGETLCLWPAQTASQNCPRMHHSG